MRSIVFIFIPLVVMVNSDVVTATDELQKQASVDQSAENETVIINSTDASTDDNDNAVPPTEVEQHPSKKAEEEAVECSVVSEQYDNLNDKLMELALQLDLLQTAVEGISGNATPKDTSSRLRLLHFAWVVDDAKCIVVTRVCMSVCVCLSAAACPHYCTNPDAIWGVVGDAS